jgi:hypothetical protein
LVKIHTHPDETVTELNAPSDVFVGVQPNGTGEDGVSLLGDMRVPGRDTRAGRRDRCTASYFVLNPDGAEIPASGGR